MRFSLPGIWVRSRAGHGRLWTLRVDAKTTYVATILALIVESEEKIHNEDRRYKTKCCKEHEPSVRLNHLYRAGYVPVADSYWQSFLLSLFSSSWSVCHPTE